MSTVKTLPPTDDRFDAIVAWIEANPTKRHVVACRTKAGVIKFAQRFDASEIEVDARHYLALQTGVWLDAATVFFSVSFTITDAEVYARLSSRLRGPSPMYNIQTGIKEPQS